MAVGGQRKAVGELHRENRTAQKNPIDTNCEVTELGLMVGEPEKHVEECVGDYSNDNSGEEAGRAVGRLVLGYGLWQGKS